MKQETQRDPSRVQGGDLTHLPDGQITLDLSLCTNPLGPPPAAVAALQHFLDHHAHRLMPPPYEAPKPPYRAERLYLRAFADRLGVEEQDMLSGRGVTEFLVILARLLRPSRVAVITPEYTETMRLFAYADFHGPADGVRDTPGLRLERLWAAMRTHDYVVLSNPSNPLGHYLPRAQLIQTCRDNPFAVLVVDEEYIEFQGPGLSLAGADVPNLIVLQSTGKTYGITATRAGMLWTRSPLLHRMVRDELPSWPLSLLDITATTAALRDETWLPTALGRINTAARRLQTLLTARFGPAVTDSDIHYRFVHLDNPYPVLDHLHAHGISARLFTRTARGSVPGLRLMSPTTDAEFDQLRTALDTLTEGRPA